MHRAPSRSATRKTWTLRLAAFAVLLTAAAGTPARVMAADSPRTVILGFDGADAKLTRQWMDEGKLPNLARLRDEGTFAPLRSTVPSQTPVSWSTFSTGLQPGRHAIFDFLKRDPANYRPSFAAFDEATAPFLWGKRNGLYVGAIAGAALALLLLIVLKLFRVSGRVALIAAAAAGIAAGFGGHAAAVKLLPVERPLAVNRQQGDTFWEILGNAGKKVRVMRMPVTFPPEPYQHGELLAGLGVPDTSGRIGKPFYFTSELFYQPRGGGEFKTEIVELLDNKGVIPTEVKGPPDKLFSKPGELQYISIPMTLTVPDDKKSLGLEVSGQKLTLRPGEWSDWVRFVFPFNSLIKLHGIGKFRLISVEPEVRLYLSSIQFDPENLPPILQITTPKAFVRDLTSRFGLFKTSGWTTDTWGIADGTADEAIFMEDVTATRLAEEKMLDGLMQDDWDVYFHYFEFTDRVQHILWRFTDPQHPSYTAEGAAQWGGKILEAYQQMDAIVGKVRAALPPGGVLFVVSDHGFASWRRTMNYNTWLYQNGYLLFKGQRAEKADLQDLFDQTGEFFVNVDWARSRAYAMGLGNIYINLKGREAQGIVEPGAEYDALRAELKAKLEAYVDEATGLHPVAHVFTRDEAYGTYDPVVIPDMFPSNSEGYRVGWQDSLGIVAQQVVETNTGVWSGDHCSVYPPLVDGILFSNRKLAADNAFMGDVMPTLLAMYGVEAPVKLDGKSLLP